MDRHVVLGWSRPLALGLAAVGLLAGGCARTPAAAPTNTYALEAAPAVNAGPPGCERIHQRILRAEDRRTTGAGTWLDAPDRMVEARRLRALHARASAMGCPIPRI
jgi:hypothetical protein